MTSPSDGPEPQPPDDAAEPQLETAGPVEPRPDSSRLALVWDLLLGSLLIGAGVAGLVLPVVPGWIWIIPGAMLVAARIPPLRRRLNDLLVSPRGSEVVRRAVRMDPIRASLKRLLRHDKTRRALRFDTRSVVLKEMLADAAESDESGEPDNEE